MKFEADFGVYICEHIFADNAAVLEGIRDPEGDWQFFCGEAHDVEGTEPRLVGAAHLTAKDSSLHALTALRPGEYAERKSLADPWVFGQLSED